MDEIWDQAEEDLFMYKPNLFDHSMVIYRDGTRGRSNDKTMLLKNQMFFEGSVGLSLYLTQEDSQLIIKLLVDKTLKQSLNILLQCDSLLIL